MVEGLFNNNNFLALIVDIVSGIDSIPKNSKLQEILLPF
jgi:hypothetical protein